MQNLPSVFQVMPYDYMWGVYYTSALAQVSATAQNILAAVAAVFQSILVLYVMGWGFGFLRMRIGVAEANERIARFALVAVLLSPPEFNAFVIDPFTNQLPGFEASAASGTQMSGTVPQQYDQLHNGIQSMIEAVKAQATGWSNIGNRFEIALVGGSIKTVLTLSFVLQMAAMALTGIVIDVFAFVCVGYLFKATEGIPNRNVGVLIGLSIFGLMLQILMQFVVQVDIGFLGTLGGTGANLDNMLAVLWDTLMVFGAGLFLAGAISFVASYIGGGAGFSATPIINFLAKGITR